MRGPNHVYIRLPCSFDLANHMQVFRVLTNQKAFELLKYIIFVKNLSFPSVIHQVRPTFNPLGTKDVYIRHILPMRTRIVLP